MINGITPPGTAPLPPVKGNAVGRSAPVRDTKSVASEDAAPPSSTAAKLAELGPPVDPGKVAEVRAAIANGSYKLDVEAIAAKMLALDLPPGS